MLQTNRWPLGVLSQETTGLMTREQVADFVLFELKAYESRGLIAPPSMQTVADQEKREAMFCHIKSWLDYSSGIFFSGYLTSVCLAVFQAIRGSICKRFRRIHNQMGPRTNECYHRLPDGEDLWLEINDVSALNIENLRSELQCFRRRTALIKLSPTVRCECKNIFGKNVRSHFPIFTVILAGRVEKNERTHSGKQRVD